MSSVVRTLLPWIGGFPSWIAHVTNHFPLSTLRSCLVLSIKNVDFGTSWLFLSFGCNNEPSFIVLSDFASENELEDKM